VCVCVCVCVCVLVPLCSCCIFLNMILLYIWVSRGICLNYYIRESMYSIAYGVCMYIYIYIYIYCGRSYDRTQLPRLSAK